MATDELKHQTDIVGSVKRDGGNAFKMSNRFLIGVPDLAVALPPFAPCVIEVKDLGKVTDRFDRQLEVTPKQFDHMEKHSLPYEVRGLGRVAFVAIHIFHRGEHRLVLMPRQAERLTYQYEEIPAIWAKREVGLYYNLAPMLDYWGAAKLGKQDALRR